MSTMTTLSWSILVYGLLIAIHCAAKSATTNPKPIIETKTFRGNGMIGVASIAGVASRNGRVSSMGSVKFFPPAEEKNSKNSDNSEPWTFTKESDDGLTIGTVHISPGSVVSSVSSIGRSNSPVSSVSSFSNSDNKNMNPEPIDPLLNFPAFNHLLPMNSFPSHSKSSFLEKSNPKPLFPRNILRSPYIPDFGNMWLYPNYPIYDPFFNPWQ